MKKLLILAFLSVFFAPIYNINADAYTQSPGFILNAPVYNSSSKTISYSADSGIAGHVKEHCGAEYPFTDGLPGGYHSGFPVVTPYAMSGGTASVASTSISGTPVITQTDPGSTGTPCGDPERNKSNGNITEGYPGSFVASGSLNVSGLTGGTYNLSLTLCAKAGTCNTQTKSFVIPAPSLTVSCSASPALPSVGQNVTWSASVSGGTGTYSYSWTGTDGLSGTGSSATKSYSTSGPKSATVSVSSGTQTASANCSVGVQGAVSNGVCSSTHYNCSAGTSANSTDGASAWTWSCVGSNGGTTASCSETKPLPAVNGKCSSTHYDCSEGTSTSNVSGASAWTWSCAGSNGGTTASCSEPKPVNGVCSSTHYGCAPGTSTNNVSGASAWTWSCSGSNGGTTASCSEPKPLPDLIFAGAIPSTATVNTPLTFSASLSNIGDASTVSTFYNIFQVASSSGGSGIVTTLAASSTSALAAGNSRPINSPSYTFDSTGTKSVRACADKSSATSPGSIGESNENNNCGPWVNVNVTATPVPVVTISASPSSGTVNTVNPTITWSATNAPTSCTATGDWTGAKAVSGSQAQGVLASVRTYTYTLTCSNGGGSSAPSSATVVVSAAPFVDLTASAPAPLTATVNTPQAFSSTVSNNGNTSTGSGFTNLFQTSPSSTGASGVVDYPVSPNMSALSAAGTAGSSAVSSKSITFTSAGTMYIRSCADKSSAANTGSIVESDDNNNCSPWTAVTIVSMSGTLTPSSSSCTIVSGGENCSINLTWSTINPEAVSSVTSSSPSANTVIFNGNNGGPSAVAIPYGSRTFYLYNNNKSLVPTPPDGSGVTVTASCASGTSWDGSKCIATATCSNGATNPPTCSNGGGGGDPDGGDDDDTCSNGTTNYPTCTVKSNGQCANQATNPPTCTIGAVAGTNGLCAPTHYNCSLGTSANNSSGVSSWTWTCLGTNGGTNAVCSELKKKPIFIED